MDGGVYDCVVPDRLGLGGLSIVGGTLQYWAATPPAAPLPPPDPRPLALQAVQQMGLKAINVGMVPEPKPGSVGLVGMPSWMWVARPDAQTWGPSTKTATAGPWTVTATGKVASVSWDMGDGQVVTCEGTGTPYEDSYGTSRSPTCGHVYTRQGTYTVTATSHWVITWQGIGQAGVIPMDLTATDQVTIGEAQVLRQS